MNMDLIKVTNPKDMWLNTTSKRKDGMFALSMEISIKITTSAEQN